MRESDLVWNVVWTGGVYPHLRHFVFSLFDRTEASFRFVANNCTPSSVEQMTALGEATDRVVETLVLDVDRMVPHGAALDLVLDARDDGPVFAFIDVDIKALAPYTADFLHRLEDHDVVTSGVEVWTEENTLAEGEMGVGGRHFYDHDGFVFGSPHVALYDREALLDTSARWEVGLHCGNRSEMPDRTWARIEEMGRAKMAYDTAKVVNIMMQADGRSLVHEEHEALLHIGGVSHYLAPPEHDFATDKTSGEFEGEPKWTRFQGIELRHEIARFTSNTLKALSSGTVPPAIGDGLDAPTEAKLRMVRDELESMVAASRPWLELTGE
ncbi:MAG: hypothetical protein R8F63_01485 [Acidimicrobiales bacterium]|nr:hypothetical protein [Acidimicrobiales bacterium]